jgi:hypothetical protein
MPGRPGCLTLGDNSKKRGALRGAEIIARRLGTFSEPFVAQ